VKTEYTKPSFSVEKNGCKISFQRYGDKEKFVTGFHCVANGVMQMPRWFRTRQPLCQVKEQLEIAIEQTGETFGLAKGVAERRQNNWKKFLIWHNEDGGFMAMDA